MIIPTPTRIRGFTNSVRLLISAGALSLLASNAHAQAVWSGGDDRGPYWSEGKVIDSNGNVVHVGNWSGGQPPTTGGSAYLGAPGTTNLDVQTSLATLTLAPGGGLNLLGNSRLTVTNTNLATDGTITNIGGTGFYPSYTNAGTLVKSAGTGTFTFDPPIAFGSLPGSVIKVNSGTLLLSGHGGVLDTVTFDPAAGTLIDLLPAPGPASGFSYFQGTLTNGAGTGTVRLSQGTMGGTNAYIVDNPQPCTFAFTGNVFQWTGGLIGFDQQNSPFINTGVMNISGDATKETDAVFTNRGLVTQSGAGQFNVGAGNNGGSFTNVAGATYDLRSDANVGQDGYPFNNAGLFKKSGGTGTSTLSVSFNNQGGTVEVDSGTLQMPIPNNTFNNGSTSTGGTFNVAAGALFDLGDGAVFTGTYTGGGGGTVRFSQGVLYTSSSTAATFNFPGAMFQWTGGLIGAGQRGHLFTNAGTLNISGDSNKVSYSVFTNQGTVIQTGKGSLAIGQGNEGGSFTNSAGATYNLASDASIGESGYPFTNAGLLEKTAGTGTSTMDVALTNTGAVAVNTGTLYFTQRVNAINGTTLTGGIWSVADGATLSFQYYPSLTVNQANISLSGVNSSFPAILSLADNQGMFALLAQRQFATAGALTNEGTLSLDAGSTLHVAGNLTDSDTATLAFAIGGTATQGSASPGVLQANGAVTLAGNLSLTFTANAVLPGSGDTLTIVSTGSPVSGSFANVASGGRLPTTDGKGSFRVTYGAGMNTVVLSDFLLPGQADMPTATLSALVPSVTANSGQIGEFLLTLSPAPISDVVVNFTIKGTALNGTDYVLLKTTKKIKAGKISKPIKVIPQGDLGGANKKTVVLALAPGDGYTVGTAGKVKVKITSGQ